jgi:hypothetical protein
MFDFGALAGIGVSGGKSSTGRTYFPPNLVLVYEVVYKVVSCFRNAWGTAASDYEVPTSNAYSFRVGAWKTRLAACNAQGSFADGQYASLGKGWQGRAPTRRVHAGMKILRCVFEVHRVSVMEAARQRLCLTWTAIDNGFGLK